MIFGKTKIATLLNLLIIGALAAAIWFYIQQQIVGEREIEFSLEVRVHAEGKVGDVIVLARSIDGSIDNDTLTVRLRGSKAALDEIFRSSNVATVTLAPRAADFEANELEPLTMDVEIDAAQLKLPPEVKIVSVPKVSIILARRITDDISVKIKYDDDAFATLTGQKNELAEVEVTGPSFILKNPKWQPVTETITKNDLPAPGKTAKTNVRIKTNVGEYFPDLKYPVYLDFKQTRIEVNLAVKEDDAEIELKLPILIMVDSPEWLNQHRIQFAETNPVFTMTIRMPKSKEAAKILTEKNVQIYAVFTGKHALPGNYDDVELRVVYAGGAEWPPTWPEWAEIVFPLKDKFKVSAIVTEIAKTTPPE